MKYHPFAGDISLTVYYTTIFINNKYLFSFRSRTKVKEHPSGALLILFYLTVVPAVLVARVVHKVGLLGKFAVVLCNVSLLLLCLCGGAL